MEITEKRGDVVSEEIDKIAQVLRILLVDGNYAPFKTGIRNLKTFVTEEFKKPTTPEVVLAINDVINMLLKTDLYAIKLELESETKLIIDALVEFGENAIERTEDIKSKYRREKRGISPEELKGYGMEYFDTATENIAYALKEIGDEVIEKGWTSATQSVANAFATLYTKAKEERFQKPDTVILNTCFAPFIVSSMKKDMDFAVEHTIKSFKDAFVKIILMDLHHKEYNWPTVIVEKYIVKESVPIIATERDIWKRGHWRKEILNYLIEIGIKTEKAEEATENIRNEMRKQISYVVEGIEKVKYNFPDITTTEGEWLDVISDIRDACHDICSGVYWDYKIKKVDDTFMWILNCMIDIEVKAINKGFGSAIDYFIDVKKFCSRKGKERVIKNVFDMYPPVDPIDVEAFEKLEKQKQEKEI